MIDRKDIINYVESLGYRINTDGSILERSGSIKNLCKSKNGFLAMRFMDSGKNMSFQVHVLVALKFLPNPLDLYQVSHMDGNKANNAVANLKWGIKKIVTSKNGICNKCGEPSVKIQGKDILCEKHFRLAQMRYNAKARNKSVPSPGELEKLVPSDMKCPVCENKMHWRGTSQGIATLQHDDDGSYKIICLSCNVLHRMLGGDAFYSIPKGHKVCKGCQALKPMSEFRKVGKRLYYRCRTCEPALHRKRYLNNKKRKNDKKPK